MTPLEGNTCNVTCNGQTRYKMILILFVFSVGLDYLDDFIKVISFNSLFKDNINVLWKILNRPPRIHGRVTKP